jgi:hypothetical protein
MAQGTCSVDMELGQQCRYALYKSLASSSLPDGNLLITLQSLE